MSQKHLRRKQLIDRTVQGTLLLAAARYWLVSLFVVGSVTVLGWIFVAPGLDQLVQICTQLPALFTMLVVSLVAATLVLPVILFDLLRLSNRFAGPIYRLQRVMREAAAGIPVERLEFRDGDHWQELARTFNELVKLRETAADSLPLSEERELETVPPQNREEEPVLV
jgi:hypothetical protein